MYSPVPGFFHWICSFGPSMLCVVVFHQLVFLYSLPLCNYTADYLSVLLTMAFGLFPVWLLGSVLLWTLFYTPHGENMYVYMFCVCLEVELQNQQLCVCSAFGNSAKQCCKWTSPRTRPAAVYEHSIRFTSSTVFGIVLPITMAKGFVWTRTSCINFCWLSCSNISPLFFVVSIAGCPVHNRK